MVVDRTSDRIPVVVHVTLHAEKPVSGRLVNLSLSGAAVQPIGDDWMNLRTQVETIVFELPEVLKVNAVLTHATEDLLRIRFVDLDEAGSKKLNAFIAEVRASTFDTFQDWG